MAARSDVNRESRAIQRSDPLSMTTLESGLIEWGKLTAFRYNGGEAGRLRGQVQAAMTTSGMASAIQDRPHQMLL